MDQDELLHLIGLTRTDGVGSITGQVLVNAFGSAKEVFSKRLAELLTVPGISQNLAKAIASKEGLKKAEAILAICQKKQFKLTHFRSEDYPRLLLEIPDAPLLLYYQGDVAQLNRPSVAIVGTRQATTYGRQATEWLISALAPYGINIISGLAAGIDACAHKKALDEGVTTWAMMATGMDSIYPATNKTLAAEILKSGGLMTEFPPGTKPDAYNFPARNRIIAGLCQATVVIESAEQGGSLITARLANDYNREVFAISGRLEDAQSKGCNALIAGQEATLLRDPIQLIEAIGLKPRQGAAKSVQSRKPLPKFTDANEKALVDQLVKGRELHIDEIVHRSGLDSGNVAFHLLNLEFAGIVVGLPGKRFTLSEEYS